MKPKKSNITILNEQIKSLEENWKRALADYQNLAKRVEADKKDYIQFATASIISKLIPSLDVLELAAAHSSDPGVQMAVMQFHDVLAGEGLQEIHSQVGEAFNPTLHECTEIVAGEPDGTIAQSVLKGYKINSFTIRPAKVSVFKLALDK